MTRLLLLSLLFLCGCGPRVLVCYRVQSVEVAPYAAGGDTVHWQRVAGPGPERIEQQVHPEAIAAHPCRWSVGRVHWEIVDRRRLEEMREGE